MYVNVLPHPPYVPDLSPTDYHLITHFDNFLTGETFNNNNQGPAKTAFIDFIKSRTPYFYVDEIRRFVLRWQMCINPNDAISIELNKIIVTELLHFKADSRKRANLIDSANRSMFSSSTGRCPLHTCKRGKLNESNCNEILVVNWPTRNRYLLVSIGVRYHKSVTLIATFTAAYAIPL